MDMVSVVRDCYRSGGGNEVVVHFVFGGDVGDSSKFSVSSRTLASRTRAQQDNPQERTGHLSWTNLTKWGLRLIPSDVDDSFFL